MAEQPDWSSLPDGILADIAGCLDIHEDFLTFRRVCRAWHSAAVPSPFSLASQSPLLLLSSYEDYLFEIVAQRLYDLLLLPRTTVAYSHGFLVINEDDWFYPTNCVVLCNLFNRDHQIRLPTGNQIFSRIALSARPDSKDCWVVAWRYGSKRYFQYLRIGDENWTLAYSPRLKPGTVEDMIFFEGKWLALDEEMEVFQVEFEGKLSIATRLGGGMAPDRPRFHQSWLCEFHGKLLSVGRYAEIYEGSCSEHCIDNYPRFSIFLWNSENGTWHETDELGDNALFVSTYGKAVLIPAKRELLGGLRSNCVYSATSDLHTLVEFSLEDQSSREVATAEFSKGLSMCPLWVFPSDC